MPPFHLPPSQRELTSYADLALSGQGCELA
jgi:hypothetical protein